MYFLMLHFLRLRFLPMLLKGDFIMFLIYPHKFHALLIIFCLRVLFILKDCVNYRTQVFLTLILFIVRSLLPRPTIAAPVSKISAFPAQKCRCAGFPFCCAICRPAETSWSRRFPSRKSASSASGSSFFAFQLSRSRRRSAARARRARGPMLCIPNSTASIFLSSFPLRFRCFQPEKWKIAIERPRSSASPRRRRWAPPRRCGSSPAPARPRGRRPRTSTAAAAQLNSGCSAASFHGRSAAITPHSPIH